MNEPRIKAFRLWERESRNGNRYFAGFCGSMGIIMFRDEQAAPREGVIAEWQVFFTEHESRAAQPRAAAVEQRRPPQRASAPVRRPKVQRWARQDPERPSMDNQAPDDPIDDLGRDDGKGKRRAKP